jgi:SAM-dependent methyltransferase
MNLESVQRVYERLGREDPMWAVLTDDRFRNNKWDPEAFFATGREEVDAVMRQLADDGVVVARDAALDFGSGVGRLSQALCEHFSAVTGVDISSTMVEAASRYNRHGARCRYVVNTDNRLTPIADASLDFIYSSITLQHVPPAFQLDYIRDFFRVLRPGGVAVFQIRAANAEGGTLLQRLREFNAGVLRPLWKRLRGRPPVQVHTLAPSVIDALLREVGAEVRSVVGADARERRSRRSLRYTVVKPVAG